MQQILAFVLPAIANLHTLIRSKEEDKKQNLQEVSNKENNSKNYKNTLLGSIIRSREAPRCRP